MVRRVCDPTHICDSALDVTAQEATDETGHWDRQKEKRTIVCICRQSHISRRAHEACFKLSTSRVVLFLITFFSGHAYAPSKTIKGRAWQYEKRKSGFITSLTLRWIGVLAFTLVIRIKGGAKNGFWNELNWWKEKGNVYIGMAGGKMQKRKAFGY